jgi:glutamate carboxypeptidase
MNDIRAYLQQKQDEMMGNLQGIVEQESPSRNKTLTDKLASSLADLFEKVTGGKAEIIKNEVYGNHVRGEWGSGKDQILLLAHFDTVWQEGMLEQMPFRIEEGKAYGPGIFDMKGGLLQGLYALNALKALGKKIDSRVVFLFTSDEEIGSPTSRPLIEREAKQSKCVLVLEPAMSPNAALKTSRKGVGIFHLKVKGVPAHSGIDYEKGISAIEELSQQISYLHQLTDLEVGTTVNVGVIKGGTTSNVVAAEAEADIDLRIKTQKEADRVIPIILGIKPKLQGTSLEITGGINRPPLEPTEQVAKMYNIAKEIAKEHLDFTLLEASTGGASDGNFTAPLAPTIDGLGAVGDGAHAKHEQLVISEMPTRSALVALLIEKLANNKF